MQIYKWDKAGFENAYWQYYYKLRGCGAGKAKWCACNDTYITYSKNFFESRALFEQRASKVIELLNLAPASKILVVGCALGFLNESLNQAGMISYGCDDSAYINSIKHKEKVPTKIENVSILEANFKQKITFVTKVDSFDCVITEDVLPSHDNYNQIFSNCESMITPGKPLKNILHIVDTEVSSPLVKKTLSEWKQLNPNHSWIDSLGNS